MLSTRVAWFSGGVSRLHLVVWSKYACGLTLVVFQEPTEPFSTVNEACMPVACACQRQEQDILLPLMIALVIIVLPILLRLLLDSRVVDMLMASIPNFVILSSFKSLFFKGLRKALFFSGNAGA